MSSVISSFFVTGGTLRHDAPSYVERQADRDLYEGLTRSEFCYVLTSRQMGKSSLMACAAHRLRREGMAVVVLDLTALGRNLTVEQWYDGLRDLVGQQLDLEDELEAFWQEHLRLGPLQRWMATLRQVVLAGIPGRIVIFVDEIDAVRSLPFDTDEFFAAVRECYNRRTQDPEFEPFCLLGVASPSDLIQDTRTTPFNIGRRIELTDFSPAEVRPLAAGLGRKEPVGRVLLERVLYWTRGHPYLTQRLCQAVAQDAGVSDAAGVDRLCEELFLSRRARERDDNLLFVRERLLRSEMELASLLDLYGRVRRGKRVREEETNALVSLLRLSGVVRPVSGHLCVRNRIYERVFDREWITDNMPDAELRRQQAAYRRGLLRASTIAGGVLAVVVSLAVLALNQARRADQQRRLAQEGQQMLRRHLYGAQMGVAQQAWEAGNVAGALQLLEAQRPEPGQEDLRGFEWRFLWRRCQGDQRFTLRGNGGTVFAVAFSPDGKILASGHDDGTVELWNVAAPRRRGVLRGHTSSVVAVAFSPNRGILATGSADATIRLWDIARRHLLATVYGHRGLVNSLAFSPDGRMLASGSDDTTVKLWDLASRRELATLPGDLPFIKCVAFSPDGKILAAGSYQKQVKLWDVISRREMASLTGHTGEVKSVVFSPDGRRLATTSWDSTVRLWDASTKREIGRLLGHRNAAWCVAFSPDSKTLAVGSDDSTVKLWDVATRQEVRTFRGHLASVESLAFSPDGKGLATASDDGTVKLWDVTAQGNAAVLRGNKEWIRSVAFSPDRRTLASGSIDGSIKLWDLATKRQINSLHEQAAPVNSVAFSPDGKMLASSNLDGSVALWGLGSKHLLATLAPRVDKRQVLSRNTRIINNSQVVFAPDGNALACGSVVRGIQVWDLGTKRQLVTLRPSDSGVRTVAFSPDGRMLASGSDDNTVKLWDVASWRELASLQGHKNNVMKVVFSPDARLLASSSWDQTIKLWDVATRRALGTLKGYSGIVDAVAFSPDGKTLAATGVDSTVTLWDVVTRQKVAILRGHTQSVTTVAFSPDGNTLASAGFDRTVHLWQAATLLGTDPLRVIAAASDQAVQLQWASVPYATAYNVYRGPAGMRSDQAVRLTPQPITGLAFTDHGPPLVNGRTQAYAAAPTYRGTAGQTLEGPRVTLQVTPVAVPPGWIGSSIHEGDRHGSVAFDLATRKIRLRGSGDDIWNSADGFYFTCTPVAGDFQITVRALSRATNTQEWAQAGPMVRESLQPGARHAMLVVPAAHGLQFKWRPTTDEDTYSGNAEVIPSTQLNAPIMLRLTRHGDRITPEYSRDDGKSFQPAGTPYQFEAPLPRNVYVGLAITSHDASQISEATFSDLHIEASGH